MDLASIKLNSHGLCRTIAKETGFNYTYVKLIVSGARNCNGKKASIIRQKVKELNNNHLLKIEAIKDKLLKN